MLTPTYPYAQVGGQEDNRATAENIDMHLNMLRGAVGAYGGSVEVVGVEQVSVSFLWGEGWERGHGGCRCPFYVTQLQGPGLVLTLRLSS